MSARIGSRSSPSTRRTSTAGRKDKLTRGAKPAKTKGKHPAKGAPHAKHHPTHHRSSGTGSFGSGSMFS